VRNGHAKVFVGKKCQLIEVTLDAQRSIFKDIELADELGITEEVECAVGYQFALDRDNPIGIHEADAADPAVADEGLAEIATHFITMPFLDITNRDVVDQNGHHFETAECLRQNLERLDKILTAETTSRERAANPLLDAAEWMVSIRQMKYAIDGLDKLAVLFGQHVFDHVVMDDLTDVHDPGSQFINVFGDARRQNAVKEDTVPGTFKVPVLRQRVERDGYGRGRIGFHIDDLDRFVGIRHAIEVVIGDDQRRQNLAREAKFTHPPPGVVIDGVDGPLLHARLREEVEDCFVQYFGFSVTGHVVLRIVKLFGCYWAVIVLQDTIPARRQ
jgi:hypothetical protein